MRRASPAKSPDDFLRTGDLGNHADGEKKHVGPPVILPSSYTVISSYKLIINH